MSIHGRMLQPPCLRSAGTVVSRGSPGKWPRLELWRRWQMAEAGCELDPGGAGAGSSAVLPASPSIELVLDVPRGLDVPGERDLRGVAHLRYACGLGQAVAGCRPASSRSMALSTMPYRGTNSMMQTTTLVA